MITKRNVMSESADYMMAKHAARAPWLQGIPVEDKKENLPENNGAWAAFVDVIKKLVDLSDDAWNAMKGLMPQDLANSVGPFLVGAVGALVHLREGYEGARLFHEAYTNEQIGQRKTRILTSATTFLFAGTGIGLSAALILGAAGLAVAGMVLMPTLICGFLTGIYSLSLWRRSYILDRAKEEEAEAERVYNDYKNNHWFNDQAQLNQLTRQIELLESTKQKFGIKDILKKREQGEPLSTNETNSLVNYNDIVAQLSEAKIQHAKLTGKMEGIEQRYQFYREQRLKAERDVAFGTIEVAASALVLIGTILMTAGLVGASIASFGALPFGILVTGVLLGFITKCIEGRDEKKGYVYSRGMRNWFIEKWKGFSNWISPAPAQTKRHEVGSAIPPPPPSPPSSPSSSAMTMQGLGIVDTARRVSHEDNDTAPLLGTNPRLSLSPIAASLAPGSVDESKSLLSRPSL